MRPPEGAGLGQKVDAGAEQQVHQTAGGAQEDAQHTADDHGGNKVRRVQHGLHDPLVALEPQLVDAQGQDDGHRETPQQTVKAEQDGVFDHPPKGGRVKEAPEPVQAHPFAAKIPPIGLVIPEGDLDAVHGDVLVNKRDDHRDQQQKIKLPVVQQARFQRLAHANRFFADRFVHCLLHSFCVTFHAAVRKNPPKRGLCRRETLHH